MRRNAPQGGAHHDEREVWFPFSPSSPGVSNFLFCLIRIPARLARSLMVTSPKEQFPKTGGSDEAGDACFLVDENEEAGVEGKQLARYLAYRIQQLTFVLAGAKRSQVSAEGGNVHGASLHLNGRQGTVCKIGELLGEPREYFLVFGREAPAFFAVDGERPLVDGRGQGSRHEGLDILVSAVITENQGVLVELIDAQRLVVLQNPAHEALAHVDRGVRENVGAQAVVCGELIRLTAFVFKE